MQLVNQMNLPSWTPTVDNVSTDSSMDSRKRKHSELNDLSDDDYDSKLQKVDSDEIKKQNHSEIEKRRRDKMNTYITELSSMVPICNAMSRKLDKLTVLRMAVQHIKTLRGSMNSYTEGHYKPSFLSDEELKHLILDAAEGFLFVVSCDRGRILYVSESVVQVLFYSQGDLLGQSWFDILHPKDIAKVKEQLSSSDLSPKEKLIDAKTMLPVKTDMPQSQTRLNPGSRRSFFCRMKCKTMASVKEEADTTTGSQKKRKSQNYDRKFCVIHCTGYLKSWAPAKLNLAEESENDSESCNLSCLVSIGRVYPGLLHPGPQRPNLKVRPMEFVTRHTMDGKYLFVDQSATLFLGYLPQELLGTSCYEYYHQDDIIDLAEIHRKALRTGGVVSQVYRFRTKEGSFVSIQTKWKNFRNPWTKEFEYLIAVNTLVPVSDLGVVESSSNPFEETNLPKTSSNPAIGHNDCNGSIPTNSLIHASTTENISRFFGDRIRAGKIGQLIAEDESELLKSQDVSHNSEIESLTEQLRLPNEKLARDSMEMSPMLNAVGGNNSNSDHFVSHNDSDSALMDSLIGREMIHASYQNNSNEGNDEAAMAVIMSLLEADAGLGGPVDFSGLPWPLP